MSGLLGVRGLTLRSRPPGYLVSVLENGVGRPVKQLKRLTLKFCDISDHSIHARRFVEEHLIDFAAKHRTVVVYAMPETEFTPQVCAEYLNGREEIVELEKKDCDDILKVFEGFLDRSGVQLVRILNDTTTQYPSIQGQWHPFTHKKDYDVTKALDYSTKLGNAWDPVGQPRKRYYRKHELNKLKNRPALNYYEKSELPLGKWGPPIAPQY